MSDSDLSGSSLSEDDEDFAKEAEAEEVDVIME